MDYFFGGAMRIGFIGLGNVGGKLASNLLNNNFDLFIIIPMKKYIVIQNPDQQFSIGVGV